MTVRSVRGLLVFVTLIAVAPLLALNEPPLTNWAVPGASPGRLSPLGDIGAPTPFVPVAPCRIVDTRGGAPLGGGLGRFTSGQTRDYDLNSAGAPCNGIPAGTTAYSLNVTVTNDTGNGFIAIYPTGNPPNPMVSLLNYKANSAVANATIVPCDAAGSITVLNQGAMTDVILDINGYFSSTPAPGTDALRIYTNNGTYAGLFENTSPTCTGTCGILAEVLSTQPKVNAFGAYAVGTTNSNFGVYGIAFGAGGTTPADASAWSAGVYGKAQNTTGNVAGVIGESVSTATYTAGVLGTASYDTGSGGEFLNIPNNTIVYLANGLYAVDTSNAIFAGSLQITGAPKNFVAPHPLDPGKEIVFASLEGPSADVFFRGTGRLVNGSALIPVPDYFRLTARDDSYSTTLTCVGAHAKLWIESEGPDGILVKGTGDAVFHYVVYAERDETRDQQPVRDNVHFVPERISRLGMLKSLPARTIALLVKNGTLNPDGTFNEATARRLGWTLPAPEAAREAASHRP